MSLWYFCSVITYYFPFFTSPLSFLERWNALNALDFEQRGRARYVFYWTHPILVYFVSYYLAQNLWFWTGIIFIRVYVSVCVCLYVCESVPWLSQKVLDRFWWNLAGCFIVIKDRFLLKMSLIGPLERKLGTISFFYLSSIRLQIYSATDLLQTSVMSHDMINNRTT